MSRIERRPAVLVRQGAEGRKHIGQGSPQHHSPAETVLQRLDGVRETGPGRWIAHCPAHDDQSPSLSLRETGDGTLLVHCFVGCPANDVLAAVGLELRDLFPGSPPGHRSAMRRGERRIPASDALAVINREALVVAVIASDMLAARIIDDETWERLATAAARIGAARGVAR